MVYQLRAALKRKDAALQSLRDKMVNLEEYWNRGQNEGAMADACWKAIEIATEAIAAIDAALKD